MRGLKALMMFSGDSSDDSALREMRRRKLEALEKGSLADFSFLAGPNEETAELVHCSKVDL